MRVILTRHGLTADNLEQRYCGGASNPPLCQKGIEQLEALPKLRQVELVYTSGLLRTAQTASILYPKAQQVACPDLREMEFGQLEGRNWRELTDDPAYRQWVEGGCLGRCPGGEDRDTFIDRCCRSFEKIIAAHIGMEELFFVVHGGTIMAILSRLGEPRRDYFSWTTPPGQSWHCQWMDDRLIVKKPPEGK